MKKILIIEDDNNIRESIDDLLRMKGYKTIVAKNGEEGLLLSETNRVDLVVCDIMMPGIDGYNVLKKMREDYKTANLPFIFLSAKSQKEDLRSGMKLGADDYLTKPFLSSELFEAIETRLSRQEVLYDRVADDMQLLNVRTNNLVNNELIEATQSIGMFSDLIINNIDYYSATETVEVAHIIKGKAAKLNRRLRNLMLFQTLRGSKIAEANNNENKKGHTSNANNLISNTTLQVAKEYKRELDINMIELANTNVAIFESNLAIIFEEVIRNAFENSKEGQLVTIESVNSENSLEIHVSNKGKAIPEKSVELTKTLEIITDLNDSFSGFGLYLAAQLTNKAGGSLSVKRQDDINEVIITLKK